MSLAQFVRVCDCCLRYLPSTLEANDALPDRDKCTVVISFEVLLAGSPITDPGTILSNLYLGDFL